ncbi:hypothetical protein [Yersinia phage vB_YenM_P744]
MAKKSDLTERLGNIAKQNGLSRKDYLEALLDFVTGQISHQQLTDLDFLNEVYFTPSTYKLFSEFKKQLLAGRTKKQALKELKLKYPRCSKSQFDAVSKL